MVVTRANLNYRSWEKNIHELTLVDLNISYDSMATADYIVFLEGKTAIVLKNRR